MVKLREPYCIQRAQFSNNESKIGIDGILSFDYMGSAEFEFGALPGSLKIIRGNINRYIYEEITIEQKEITVFFHKDFKSGIIEYLKDLATRKFRLKEYSDFDNYIYDDTCFKNKTDFWWDIDNHIMWWKTNTEFGLKFKIVIQPNKEK